MGISFTIGAVVAAYTIASGEPWIPFAITFVLCFIVSVQAFFLSRELETNEQATVKDRELLKYEQRKRQASPYKYADGQLEVERPGLCQ